MVVSKDITPNPAEKPDHEKRFDISEAFSPGHLFSERIALIFQEGSTDYIDIIDNLNVHDLNAALQYKKDSPIRNKNLNVFIQNEWDIDPETTTRELLENKFFFKILVEKAAELLIVNGLYKKTSEGRFIRTTEVQKLINDEIVDFLRKNITTIFLASLDKFADYRDFLTCLWSTEAFETILEISIEKGQNPIVAMIDFNKFKIVNDTYGHDVGDIVLQIFGETAQAVFEEFRGSDIVARVGGDEFAAMWIFNEIEDPEKREGFSKKIQLKFDILAANFATRLETHPQLKDKPLTHDISFSTGLYLPKQMLEHQNTEERIKHLRKVADQALYLAKEAKEFIDFPFTVLIQLMAKI